MFAKHFDVLCHILVGFTKSTDYNPYRILQNFTSELFNFLLERRAEQHCLTVRSNLI